MTSTQSILRATVIAASLALSCTAGGATTALRVAINGLDATGRLADRAAFCPPSGSGDRDVSPGVTWSPGPAGTRSYVLMMSDPDVPVELDLINKPKVTIPREAPRMRVFHWVLIDIPSDVTVLPEGADGDSLVPHGKPVGPTAHGLRGANVFTSFLAKSESLAGVYGGYDGPCPPTNDQRVHRYVVEVFALDLASLGLSGSFTGPAVESAMQGHILAKGEAAGTYSLFGKP